ncbi:hypothetical protein BU25DRAFT_257765 [Macroventuria anomochaeta]|uniref:Uncharacterized protein n=1 Tax=Macroventuria anomochaeta TaxID=301207 RepID=A0ACB6SBE7_9PLEO|nr:uncharacterized protein BU25DRAFT_257765 [Macroventuria anomochaeta]KAF2630427.1 hypothetical protein BU25DRAFT_257765 [Macroventuria anomochaeta]
MLQLRHEVTAELLCKIGSIAAGGRYGNFVGGFSSTQMPCVGVSFGIDRSLTMLSIREQSYTQKSRNLRVDVWLIASGGRTVTLERMTIAFELRQTGIRYCSLQRFAYEGGERHRAGRSRHRAQRTVEMKAFAAR